MRREDRRYENYGSGGVLSARYIDVAESSTSKGEADSIGRERPWDLSSRRLEKVSWSRLRCDPGKAPSSVWVDGVPIGRGESLAEGIITAELYGSAPTAKIVQAWLS